MRRMDSPLGMLLLGEENGAICALRFALPDEEQAENAPESAISRAAEEWLCAYFAGKVPGAPPPLMPRGTEFQKRVWAAASEIHYGQTCTYGELAARIGCRSARAVGAALGKNPIWLFIPCHRVIGKDGSLTGYAGGVQKKAALLALERGTR